MITKNTKRRRLRKKVNTIMNKDNINRNEAIELHFSRKPK